MDYQFLNTYIGTMEEKGNYSFFICSCPAMFPFNFAKHFRIVTNKKGQIHRREVCHFRNKQSPELGYIHKDFFAPWAGIQAYPRRKHKVCTSEIHYHTEGDSNSLARKLVEYMESYSKKYPRKQRYRLFPGPNSNTFIQWILDNNPDIKTQLPRRAFGKNFKEKTIP